MPREPFSGHLDLLLLAALRRGPRHGYAISEHIRRLSGGRFDYPDGTIYPALNRLEGEGLLSSRWVDLNGRRRRVYELTRKGDSAFAGRQREWERHAGGIAAVLEQS
jgi:PadR family transcriptional regulator, regulatory protein PadR